MMCYVSLDRSSGLSDVMLDSEQSFMRDSFGGELL